MFVRNKRGYTLIELLTVIGIMLMMLSMAVLSVTSMLRSVRMNNAQALLVSSIDEARTSAMTMRRATRLDLTTLDDKGAVNRLSVVGRLYNENFESYDEAPAGDPANAALEKAWMSNTAAQVCCEQSRCLKLHSDLNAPVYCYSAATWADPTNADFEMVVQARMKILGSDRTYPQQAALLGCARDVGSGKIDDAYVLKVTIAPSTAGQRDRNNNSIVSLERLSGGVLATTDIDVTGVPNAATCNLTNDVWYRFMLSIKRVSLPAGGAKVTLAGKVWADGQLEPWIYTLGPVADSAAPLRNGYAGVFAQGCDALADDVLFDPRPVRQMPENVRIDCLEPLPGKTDPCKAADYRVVPLGTPSPYAFPLLFHPDGTTAVKSILRLTDLGSGDRTYLVINPNTGRPRVAKDLDEAALK
jgi:prepilin-type N-terminal cleavage/methylation domain-containing protein